MQRNPDILLVWPPGHPAPHHAFAPSFRIRPLAPFEDDIWVRIHRQSVPSFAESDLRAWLARYRRLALPGGILLAEEEATGVPVATAGSIANDKQGMFPSAGQLAWVATLPTMRQRGLATWLSTRALVRLLNDGYRRVFVCTGDDLLPAIRIYLRLGFLPCLYAADQGRRWAAICSGIGVPFEPDRWPDVARYLEATAEPLP